MPSLESLKGGYRISWRTGGRGSKQEHSPLYSTKPAAMAALELITAQRAAQKPIRVGALLALPELLLRWEASRVTKLNDASVTKRTASRMRKHIGAEKWGTTLDVTPAAVEAWRANWPQSERAGACLRAFLRWCRDYAGQPVQDQTLIALRPPPRKRRPRADLLTAAEVRRAQAKAAKLSKGLGALVHCLSTYGWRPITACRLKVGDMVDGQITTRVKGGDVVRHPLLPETIRLLRAIAGDRSPQEPLFLDPRSGHGFSENGSASIPQWGRDVLGLHTYNLKRYAISSMLGRGIAPQEVALFTGHRTLSQVLTYARTNEDRARKALKRMEHRGARGGLRRGKVGGRQARKPGKVA